MYQYIALLNGLDQMNRDGRFDDMFRQLGLPRKLSSGGIVLYVAKDTPIRTLTSGGVLIGHVFPREQNVSDGSVDLRHLPASPKLVECLIEKFWGEYLLIYPSEDGSDATTVVRDPSGGVDCVYSLRERFITSDISIATRSGLYRREIDWDFIRSNALYPHYKAGRTGLAGLRELLPGCQLHLGVGKHAIQHIWSPWTFVSPRYRHRDRHEARDEVRLAVSSTVKRWAEADRSVLLELSGGLDSSIVAACLQGANARVACCNLVTPVPGADEQRYASPMAGLLGVELHIETLDFDERHLYFQPPPHAVAPSTWFLQQAANELNEVIGTQLGTNSFFSGGGGDTVFCYTRTAAPAADAFRERGAIACIRTIRDLAELHQCTFWKAGRLTLKKLLAPPRPPRKPDTSFLSTTLVQERLDPHPWFAAPDNALAGDRERIFDLVGTQVFRDGLARGAKWPMRMPLLSQPVMEACLKVPSWMWIADGRNRAIARDAFADVLPPDILHRRSKGTFMNYAGAFYRHNKHRIRDYLLTGQLQAHGLLDSDSLQRFFNRELTSREDTFMRIFDLCAIENWVRHQTTAEDR